MGEKTLKNVENNRCFCNSYIYDSRYDGTFGCCVVAWSLDTWLFGFDTPVANEVSLDVQQFLATRDYSKSYQTSPTGQAEFPEGSISSELDAITSSRVA